jgi:hypothetical protein
VRRNITKTVVNATLIRIVEIGISARPLPPTTDVLTDDISDETRSRCAWNPKAGDTISPTGAVPCSQVILRVEVLTGPDKGKRYYMRAFTTSEYDTVTEKTTQPDGSQTKEMKKILLAKRVQFPTPLSYGLTVNQLQGAQIDPDKNLIVIMHGLTGVQIYVALSRATNPNRVFLLEGVVTQDRMERRQAVDDYERGTYWSDQSLQLEEVEAKEEEELLDQMDVDSLPPFIPPNVSDYPVESKPPLPEISSEALYNCFDDIIESM